MSFLSSLPFKIGTKFEDLKFNLEIEDSTSTYLQYRYTKGDILMFEGHEVTDIFLYFNLKKLFQVEMYLEQGRSVFDEFYKSKNGLSFRVRLEEQTKLIEFTYGIENIWKVL